MTTGSKKFGVSAAIAAAALPAGAATAADLNLRAAPPAPVAAPNPFFVSLEGGAAFSDYSRQGFADSKLGASPSRDLGAYGSISIGRNIEGTQYDWRISASATQFMTNEASAEDGYVGYLSSNSKSTAGFQAADIDFGRRFSSGALEARVFGGLRALHEQSSAEFGVSAFGYYGGSVGLDHRFLGFGPRIGAEVRYGYDLGVVASVSAAALYGRHDTKQGVEFNYFGYTLGSQSSDSRYDWVTDVAGSLGLSYRPSKMTEFVAGYRGERLYNIDAAPEHKNRTAHGPFVRAKVSF